MTSEQVEPIDDLDIAVIGLACRFPGAETPAQYWANLAAGVESIRQLTTSELEQAGVRADEYTEPGYVRAASVLEGADRFDAAFFGYSPREAERMDPQARVLLECAWEAFEDAGYAPPTLGRPVGVFVAGSPTTYLLNNLRHELHTSRFILADGNLQHYLGNAADFLATRVSYKLNLRGPSVNVQTACSGSLVGVHLARQSLLSGECDMALAGGVSIYLPQHVGYLHREGLILSPDGHCRPFDVEAGGTVFGRGAGAVVLKRLSDAVAHRDRIYAVLKGSAINNDGDGKVGFTAPSVQGQAEVIAEAYANAGISADTIGYVEAHGTATAQGDPIEIAGLTQAFRQTTKRRAFCAIGSVKGNIGHLDAAAGMAGFIKTVLALDREAIPASLHFTRPNPVIDFSKTPFRVNQALTQWKRDAAAPRRAGVSAFGMGGTNAHVVLEEAPRANRKAVARERPRHVLTLSARHPAALAALASRYQAALGDGDAALADLCFTANVGRVRHAHRAAITGASHAEMQQALARIASAQPAAVDASAEARLRAGRRVAWLFTGQGAQYAGMGRGLYDTQPTFRAAIDRAAAALDGHMDRPLVDVLYGSAGTHIDDTAYAQPALFAVEYALADLWRSWGIEPAAVVGHSLGEYVAAAVAGVFSLEAGIRLVAERGRLMQALPRDGAMAAVFAPEALVAARIAAYSDVAIAAVNGPSAIVISGWRASVEAILAALAAEHVDSQPLAVSHAFHSPLMEPMLDALEAAARSISFEAPQMKIVSNLTGRVAAAGDMTSAAYWRRHAREPVAFGSGMATLADLGCDAFVEIGPHPTLTKLGRASVPGTHALWAASLVRGQDDWTTMLDSVASLWTNGVEIDWAGFDRDYPRSRVALPTYPFQRERYWIEARPHAPAAASPESPSGSSAANRHPLLGRAFQSPALRDVVFESRQTLETLGVLADHRLAGQTVLPMTGFLEMAVAATARPGQDAEVSNVDRTRALFVDETPQSVQVIVSGAAADPRNVEIVSTSGEGASPEWRRHASMTVSLRQPRSADGAVHVGVGEIQARCPERLSGSAYYEGLAQEGFEYGPAFRGIDDIWRRDGEALARIVAPPTVASVDQYRAHPAIVDACVQPVYAAMPAGLRSVEWLFVPVALERFAVHGDVTALRWSHVQVVGGPDAARVTAVVRGLDETGAVVIALDALVLQRVSRRVFAAADGPRDWLYELRWQPQALDLPRDAIARPSVGALTSAVGDARDLRQVHGLDIYRAVEPALHDLATFHVIAALDALGWRFEPGARFSTLDLADTLGVVAQQRPMLERMLEMLAEDGMLERAGDEWRVQHPFVVPAPAPSTSTLIAAYPECRAELTMVERCGRGLASVLRGVQDPLELLFPNGSLDDLEALYSSAPFTRACNTLVRRLVEAALAAWPAGQRLRVLEIGAGTGGTASWVVPTLAAGGAEYVFTDVSGLFLSKARQRFAEFSRVDYRRLDIERHPGEQGFDLHAFDIVIATNSLHATADLTATMTHVRDLVADGGLLILVEALAPQRWIDVIFGITDGWWRFTDRKLRPSYPLLDPPRWRALLEATGFEHTTFAPSAEPHEAFLHQAVIVASATHTAEALPESKSPDAGGWIIVADGQGVGAGLSAALAGRGRSTRVATLDSDVWARADRDEAVRALDAASPAGPRHVVYLAGLDLPDELESEVSAVAANQARSVGGALRLVQAMLAGTRSEPSRLTIVTRGAQPVAGAGPTSVAQASLWGFGRSIAIEHPELACRRVDLDPAMPIDIAALVAELDADADEDEVALRGAIRHVARIACVEDVELEAPAAPDGGALTLAVGQRGLFDSLSWQQVARRAPGDFEVEVQVDEAGLNFKDVLKAIGTLPGTPGDLGLECAGRVTRVGARVEGLAAGDHVVVMAPGSFSTFVTLPAHFVVHRPATLSASAAAGVPVAFVTAHYGLVECARISAGDRVLIHAATGGVGLAALQIAERAGAEVFATAGSDEKRRWLRARGVAHVMDSRSTAFVDEIRAATAGRGVDVVLSASSDAQARASLSVLAEGGRFIELGKTHILDAAEVQRIAPGARYEAIDVNHAYEAAPERFRAMLTALLDDCAEGRLTPLPQQAFERHHVAEAFRFMGQARHIGKIVLKIAQQDPHETAASLARPGATYLVTGAFGGIGLLVAERLADRGATHLLLMGRRAPSPAASSAIEALAKRGVQVKAVEGDVSVEADVRRVLDEARRSLPPIRGVFHAAGTVEDRMAVQQDWGRFARVMAAKVTGSWLLHEHTRDLPLDAFVLFSTYVSLYGSAGQSNHAAANAYMDALASYRRHHGLAALSVNWGPWADIGAAVNLGVTDRLARQGFHPIPPKAGIDRLEALTIRARQAPQSPAQIAVAPIDWAMYLAQSPIRDVGRWREVGAVRSAVPGTAGAPATRPAVAGIEAVLDAPVAERPTLLLGIIHDRVARSLGLGAAGAIDPVRPLVEMGLDSLLAVEVRSVLGQAIGRSLPATLLFDHPTLDALTIYLGRDVLGLDPWRSGEAAAEPAVATRLDALASIEELNDEDVERQLAERLMGRVN